MAKLNADNDTSTMRKYIGKSMNVMLAFSCAIMFGLLAVGRDFAPIFFGEGYEDCGRVLQLLAVGMLLIAWSNVIRTQYLIPCKRDRVYLVAVWSGAVVSVVLNAILIPHLQALGAAIATVAAELVVCIIQTVCVLRELPTGIFFKNLFGYGVIGAIMLIAVRAVSYLPLSNGILLLVVQVVVGAVVYLPLAATWLWFTDRELLQSVIKPIKRILKKLHLAR